MGYREGVRKSIVVHAGLPKTGTSAIQAWLHRNRGALAGAGIDYPDHILDQNGIGSGNLRALAEFGPNRRWRPSGKAVAATLARFDASTSHTLLLSSELFANWIPKLSVLLPVETKFVLYVRDPLEFLESSYNQSVKRAGTTDVFDAPASVRGGWLGRGHAEIEPIIANAPQGTSIDVRPYHRSLFFGGSILIDLFSAAGLEVPTSGVDSFDTEARVNTSYTLHALEFKRTINHLPVEKQLDRRIDYALQACPLGPSHYTIINPVDQARLREQADSELASLRDRFALTSLEPLREVLRTQAPKPFEAQRVDDESIAGVADHLRSTDPELHVLLRDLLAQHEEFELPYPSIRSALR